MNYEIILKCRELPLRPNEKAIAMVLATYTGFKTDSCFPSYLTIHKDTQASDATIKDTIDLLSTVGVIDYRNRADISTGKKSNEYRFIFTGEGIKFYKSKGSYILSDVNRKLLKSRITLARNEIKEARKVRAKERKASLKAVMNTPPPHDLGKSQNLYLNVRNTQGLEGCTNTPRIDVNTPPLGGRSIERSEKTTIVTSRLADNLENRKNKKMVKQDEVITFEPSIEHASNINTPAKKSPSEQSREEWLDDYGTAD